MKTFKESEEVGPLLKNSLKPISKVYIVIWKILWIRHIEYDKSLINKAYVD